jgi:hypothetical protein
MHAILQHMRSAHDTLMLLHVQAQGASAGTAIALSAFAAGGNAAGGGAEGARAPWPGPGRHSSRFKGVSWAESSAKWRAQCWNGTKVRIGILTARLQSGSC